MKNWEWPGGEAILHVYSCMLNFKFVQARDDSKKALPIVGQVLVPIFSCSHLIKSKHNST